MADQSSSKPNITKLALIAAAAGVVVALVGGVWLARSSGKANTKRKEKQKAKSKKSTEEEPDGTVEGHSRSFD